MFKKKSLITLVSLLAILCVTVGGTLAFLVDTDGPINNIFNPSKVTTEVEEKLDQEQLIKKDVKIKNTGDTDAYIRAAVVVTWQNKAGEVYGKLPVSGTDYEISYDLKNGWSLGSDGFYYWKGIVKSDDEAPKDCWTGVLITSCKPKVDPPAEGYFLNVEIIGSGIQAKGKDANGKTPVELAWGEAAAQAVGAK